MRIAMLSADLPSDARSGVAHQVARLADTLVARGHDVTAFSFSPAPAGARFATHTFDAPPRLARTKPGLLVGAPVAFAARRYRGFDVVHAHGDDYLIPARRAALVRTFYGSALDEARHAERLRRKLAQRALYVGERASRRKATVTVGISASTAASVGRLDEIIPCGVDRERFTPGEKSPHPSILFVGTIRGRKRGYLAVEAFERSVRRAFPAAELWVVADREVRGPGIRCFGRVHEDELVSLFRRAWVFTLPSSYEGFGVPYIEAMASGTAVVATPNPGAEELVAPPSSGGVVVEPRELGPALAALLADDVRRRELEQAGREFSRRFGWPEIASRYEEAYRLALVRRGPRSSAV
jgi:phosphatidylinositol alpha-mannosyltransferase